MGHTDHKTCVSGGREHRDRNDLHVRESSGILKGFDPLRNLVLDNRIECLWDLDDAYKLTKNTQKLGLVVCWGPAVVVISPLDGIEAIANPFIQQEEKCWRNFIFSVIGLIILAVYIFLNNTNSLNTIFFFSLAYLLNTLCS